MTTPPPEMMTGNLAVASSSAASFRLCSPPGPRSRREGLGDLAGDVAVEVVARDVELGRAHFAHGAVEAAAGELGHALGIVHMALVLGEFLEHRQLVGFLEAAEAHAHGAGFGGDDHHRAVRPVGGGDGRHAVADAGAVLADDHAVAARHAGIAVGHVAGALLVHHRDQADAGRGEDVHGVHEGRAHDAEHVGHAVGDHGFDEGFGRGHAGGAFGHLAVVGLAHGGLLSSMGNLDGIDTGRSDIQNEA
jgi:hypothetical protein